MFCWNIKVSNKVFITQLSTPISQSVAIRRPDRAIPAIYEPRTINANYKAAIY